MLTYRTVTTSVPKRLPRMFLGLSLALSVFSAAPLSFSQELLHEVSSLNIYDERIHSIFNIDSLLFVVRADNKNWDGFSVNIYNVADFSDPFLIGKQHKDTYEGEPEFEGRVVHLVETGLRYPFYVVLSEDGTEALHRFWYPNKVVEANGYFFEFRWYDPEVRIHQAVSPTGFQQVKSHPLSAREPEFSGLALIEDVIYVATRNAGLIILDVADLDAIVELTSAVSWDNLIRMMAGEGMVWIEDESGEIVELDVSDPRQPVVTRTVSDIGYHLTGIWSNGKFYLKGENGVGILDSSFSLEKSIDYPAYKYVESLTKSEHVLIVSSTRGIEFYDLADDGISRLSRVSARTLEPYHFDKQDRLLFVADFAEGLTIVDVTDVRQPRLLSRYYLDGNARDIEVAGDYAYVADFVKGLVIIDISQPENPGLVSSLHIEGGAKSLALIGEEETIVLSSNENSLFAIDVSDKSSPQILQELPITTSTPWNEWWVDDNVVFAGGHVWNYFEDSPLFVHEYGSINGLVLKTQFGDEPIGWGWANEIKALDDRIFLSTETGIRVIDMRTFDYIVGDPGFASGMEWSPEGVALKGDTLYVSRSVYGVSGIEAYDISGLPNRIRLQGYVSLYFSPHDMVYDDGFLYVLTPAGIGIYSPALFVGVDDHDSRFQTKPSSFHLSQSFPNPFRASTTITVWLPKPASVSVGIYDLMGRKIRTLHQAFQGQGALSLEWYGSDDDGLRVSSGVYLCRVRIQTNGGTHEQTRKLLMIR